MNPQSMDVTNMVWRPALIALTLMPRPEVDDGKPTQCFVDPNGISAVWRTNVKHDAEPDAPGPTYTIVHCCHFHLMVVETPAEIALLRDRALGHERKPQVAT